jgi:hypothetical protein
MIEFRNKSAITVCIVFLFQVAFLRAQDRVGIMGTKCSMVLPKGFLFSGAIGGFINEEKGASIMVSELPIPYENLVNGFTVAELKRQGIVLKSKKTIDFQKSQATMYLLNQKINNRVFIKHMLLFAAGNQCIMVNGIYPEEFRSIEPQVKEALLSTRYNSKQKSNPLQSAPFVLNIDGTGFKFTNFLSGSYLYSIDGKMPTENPIFIVSKSIDFVQTEDQMKFAQERLMSLPGCASGVIKTLKPISVDSLGGYEIEAECKSDKGGTELIYQVILYPEKGGYYLMVGKTKKGTEQYPEKFKKLALRFRRK